MTAELNHNEIFQVNLGLQTYFDENPRDLKSLRHDKALHTVKLQDHLTDVPDYIVPSSLRDVISNKSDDVKPRCGIKFKAGRNKAFRKYMVSCRLKEFLLIIISHLYQGN